MTLARDYHTTVVERLKNDPEAVQETLNEAIQLMTSGEAETARLLLRDLVNATVGFEQLSVLTSKPSKSLHRMLSSRGNPGMNTLSLVFSAIRHQVEELH